FLHASETPGAHGQQGSAEQHVLVAQYLSLLGGSSTVRQGIRGAHGAAPGALRSSPGDMGERNGLGVPSSPLRAEARPRGSRQRSWLPRPPGTRGHRGLRGLPACTLSEHSAGHQLLLHSCPSLPPRLPEHRHLLQQS
ncbi:unnamed protein product, partial [Polarella glacialis]